MKKQNANSITAPRFDALIEGAPGASSIIWTAKGIGEKIGRTEQWVRKVLAKAERSPVRYTASGQLYAVEAELLTYFSPRGMVGEPQTTAHDR